MHVHVCRFPMIFIFALFLRAISVRFTVWLYTVRRHWIVDQALRSVMYTGRRHGVVDRALGHSGGGGAKQV